jgi:hypothetical protein
MKGESEIPQDVGRGSDEGWRERLIYAVYLCAVVAGIVLCLQGLSSGSGWNYLEAGLFLTIGGLAREYLRWRGKLEKCYDSLINCDREEEKGSADDQAMFRTLLDRLAILEQARGKPGFDVWEYQEVRRQLKAFAVAHPDHVQSARLFQRTK